MIEMTVFGRGGQGGVTLAKLIANAYFLRDKYAQAFGVYAAERSGAPLQAYVRIDDQEITNHNQVRRPDHVMVLDSTLIGEHVATSLKGDGWIVLNSSASPRSFAETFPGRRVATIDATAIALANDLGTRAVPIVNTTMLGAAAKVLGLELADVEAALETAKFGGGNIAAAREAFERVATEELAGLVPTGSPAAPSRGPVAGLFDEVVGAPPTIHTGDWATRQPHWQDLTPPCNHGCPAGNDVRSFIEAVGRQDYDTAMEVILRTSPMPGICGRVCPAPCVEACNRSEFDEAINIREIERAIADRGQRPDPARPWRKETVAVVGSGPAGLSTAYHAARCGYHVTLFEGGEELGGVMRTGIPGYRLPHDVLDREIEYILDHGVTVKTGHFVRRADLLKMTYRYAAVFIATGLQASHGIDLGGAAADAVEQGIDFLDRARHGGVSLMNQQILVIGGGNTAFDAARTARRLGAHVRIVYRRTRSEMPAIREEIEEAVEEGIALDELVSPLRIRHDGVGTLLTCLRMRLGEPDDSGRPRPIPETTDDAYFDLRCDRVILALGQTPDLSIMPEGSELHDGKELLGLTGAPVFAGGDFVTNDGTVAAAIGSGRRAAWHIHLTLTGENLFPPPPQPIATPEAITMHVFSHAPRHEGGELSPAVRRRSFAEVRLGFSGDGEASAAVTEARRCFSCGVCNTCDRCVTHCPEGIVRREADGYRFDYDYCKGCGLCASQCPRGVIYMAEL